MLQQGKMFMQKQTNTKTNQKKNIKEGFRSQMD
jgi:hypothetical protein